MAKRFERDNVPLSRLSVLAAQLESIAASAPQQPPDPILCFDLLSELVNAIQEESKEAVLSCQRKCEDALYSLLVIGACRPVRRLASMAMSRLIANGDAISIYSRASTLQGWLSDGKRSDISSAGAAQCLGELYRCFGRRITSGLTETTNIVGKLMKFHEAFVRQEALQMLGNAIEGCGGTGASAAYTEAFRIVVRIGVPDKSSFVRLAAAKCLKSLAGVGGPGLGIAELESSASFCVKGLEDPFSSVRDAFAEALGALLALSVNPESQVHAKGKEQNVIGRKLEGGLQKHLVGPFIRASGGRSREVHVGLALSWVFFLQAMRLKYLCPETELQNFALQALNMLLGSSLTDSHSMACVLYVLRVGVIDQMTEVTQRSFLIFLGKQLDSSDISPYKAVAVLRALSYLLMTLGEVPIEFKEVIDYTVFLAMSHTSSLVRIEAALTLRTLAEVDPVCVGGLISYGVTTLQALRESTAGEKGERLKVELNSLHGQAVILGALVSISPKLKLGYPAKLPISVLNISKKMLTEFCRNPVVSAIEKESGWLLLASLLGSMPKEELEEQVFDIMSLWAGPFGGSPETKIMQIQDMASELRVWSSSIEALTAFIRSFISPTVMSGKAGIFLQPALYYLSRALYYASTLATKPSHSFKLEMDLFVIRTLVAYQALLDPMTYKKEHSQILKLCTSPFKDPSVYEESSGLKSLLDKRDACLGPWVPGRDWLEDELRAFEGGSDGLLPCVWDHELSSFPQPAAVGKVLVNQMLLCFGTVFATQDKGRRIELLSMIEHSLKAGKKQPWHGANMTNACVALLASLKAMTSLRFQALEMEILEYTQAIFQFILAEGDISAALRRASAEGLGLVARLGNDVFTPKMTRLLLADIVTSSDPSYIGSIAFSLGCIHCRLETTVVYAQCLNYLHYAFLIPGFKNKFGSDGPEKFILDLTPSAGGMALSMLVPATVSSLSLLAKNANASLRVWSLHGLLLTIEAAGLSYASHVQATLNLVMDVLLSEENGWVDLQQEVGRLVNVIVSVIGPELSPQGIFFSRCKSVVAEISSGQETLALLECVRFTQQLVIFAPQAISIHSHVQTLLSTLSSRQPTLRYLAVSTLRHLVEKDPVAVIDEKIEVHLFHMLDEETDPEIGKLVRSTIKRLLLTSCPSCPSRWISLCYNVVLATSNRNSSENNAMTAETPSNINRESDSTVSYAADDEDMIAHFTDGKRLDTDVLALVSGQKHLRYKTRAFAAECLSYIPAAVGTTSAHFDISLARQSPFFDSRTAADWLVLHLDNLVGLAYQISTCQFEKIQPIGVELLNTIMDKFEKSPDPELPGHFLMEQYQAQLVSAVRTALNASSDPLLLEAGLKLATRIFTSSIISGDRVALNRLFLLISRPLNDIKDLYYPSFAEWVACKIVVRLLSAHAAIKCYVYSFFNVDGERRAIECMSLIPLLSENAHVLGNYWIRILSDYSYVCFALQTKTNYKPFLDGLQYPMVSSKVRSCLDESWSVILKAVVLDAVPAITNKNEFSKVNMNDKKTFVSGYRMVKLDVREFHFLWGFAMLLLFQGPSLSSDVRTLTKSQNVFTVKEFDNPGSCACEVALIVFQSLMKERFYGDHISQDHCKELLQVLLYFDDMAFPSSIFVVIFQIIQYFPEDFFEAEDIVLLLSEICLKYIYKVSRSSHTHHIDDEAHDNLVSTLFTAAEKLIGRLKLKFLEKLLLAILSTICTCLKEAISHTWLLSARGFLFSLCSMLERHLLGDVDHHVLTVLVSWQSEMVALSQDCTKIIDTMKDNKKINSTKHYQLKLSVCIEQTISVARLSNMTLEHKANTEEFRHFLVMMYDNCSKCLRFVLTNTNVEVQRIGLLIFKSLAQKEVSEGPNVESRQFLLFLAGEHFGDIFFHIMNLIENPVGGESATIVGEWLKLLVLLQTLAESNECKRGLLNFLLECLILVLSVDSDEKFKEIAEMKSNAMKLVAHIAQISSTAVQFKELLLAMPLTKRQQFQDIIRASVGGGLNSQQSNFQLPIPLKDQFHAPKSTLPVEEHIEADLDYGDDEWDTFQSFSAAIPATNSAKGSGVHVSSSDQVVHEKECNNDQNNQLPELSDLTTSPDMLFGSEDIFIGTDTLGNNDGISHGAENEFGKPAEELKKKDNVASDQEGGIVEEVENIVQDHNRASSGAEEPLSQAMPSMTFEDKPIEKEDSA